VVEANDRALELLGRPAHRVIDRPWPQPWWPTEDAAALRRPDAGAGELETTVARPAGDRVTVIAAHAPLRAEAGEGRPGVVITLKDVTARRRAELALRRAAAEQEGLRRVSEAIVRGEERDPVLARVAQEAARVSGGVAGAVVQQDGKALRIVARWGRGADPPAGPEGPPGAATARRAVAHDRPCAEESAEGAGVAAWHVAAPVRVRGRVWGAVLVTGERHAMTEAATGEVFAFAGLASMAVEHALQLEERERLEQELHQAQKMEALGQLASGVAHEINTPIQFVGDSVAFLVDAFGDLQVAIAGLRRGAGSAGGPAAAGPVDAEDLDFLLTEVPRALMRTEAGVERVAEIVRAMRAFAHPSRASRRRCSLNEVVRSALTVAHNELKHVAEVSVDLDEHLPEIDCAPSEIGQVALNLLVNAAHAIGDLGTPGARGVISVGTRRGAEAGQVELLVADTGVGIPPAVLPRIFEPFFTTKEVGRGSGQGLALAHRVVVDDHGGRIDVDSTPGGGSTFRIVLPVGG
jgi:PAS domain S-box-containing protein